MFSIISDIISDLGYENENLKNTLKEVTEAMVLLAALAGSERNTDVPWALLAEKARKLYETGK